MTLLETGFLDTVRDIWKRSDREQIAALVKFRDEYIDLATDEQLEAARQLSKHVFTFEEFIAREIEKGAIRKEQFTTEKKVIQLHGHCQQKALSSGQIRMQFHHVVGPRI